MHVFVVASRVLQANKSVYASWKLTFKQCKLCGCVWLCVWANECRAIWQFFGLRSNLPQLFCYYYNFSDFVLVQWKWNEIWNKNRSRKFAFSIPHNNLHARVFVFIIVGTKMTGERDNDTVWRQKRCELAAIFVVTCLQLPHVMFTYGLTYCSMW